MEEYAGRVLADRYRLPLPPSDEYELAESRAWDTYSGQEVLVRQVPLPEVVEAEVLDADGLPEGFVARDGGVRRASARTTRRPTEPAVRRAIEAAQAAAQIPDHPRLDQVFDVFAEGGSLWVVSELVAARPLAALLADKPLSPYRAAEVAADVLTALRVLHAHGWVHRNITVRTVLVCDDGRVMLTGLAAGAAEEALCGYDPVPVPDSEGDAGAGGPGGPGVVGPGGAGAGRSGAADGPSAAPGAGAGGVVGVATGGDADAARRAAIEARAKRGGPLVEGAPGGRENTGPRALEARGAGGSDAAPSAPGPGGDIRAARAGAIAAYRAGARAAARVHEGQRGGPAALPAPRPAPQGDASTTQDQGHAEGQAQLNAQTQTPIQSLGQAQIQAQTQVQPQALGPGVTPIPGHEVAGYGGYPQTSGHGGPAQGQTQAQGQPQAAYGAGPGQVPAQGLGHGQGSAQGFGPAQGAGHGVGYGQVPAQGLGQGPAQGLGPVQGPGSGVGHGPGSAQGLGHGQDPAQGPGHGQVPAQGLGQGPVQGLGPAQGPGSGVAHGQGSAAGLGPAQGPGQGPGPAQGPAQGLGPAQVAGHRQAQVSAPYQVPGHGVENRSNPAPPGQIADPYGVGRTNAWHGAQPRAGAQPAPGTGTGVGGGSAGEGRAALPGAASPGAALPGVANRGTAPWSGTPAGTYAGGGTSVGALPAGGGVGSAPPASGDPMPVPGEHPTAAIPVGNTQTQGTRWDQIAAGAPPRRGPATALAAERARQARMAVVGPVTERWAPEQAGPVHENWQLAAPIGPATDLWALGALLFRAVQGHAPYPEENTAELVQLVCAEPPAFAEECGPLRPVVESLLRQDPTERLDFEELRGWLRSLVRSAPEAEAGAHVVAAPPVNPSRLPIVRRRGELVRRRRAGLPATSPHARHKRARQNKQVKPRRLGRNLVLLVLLLLAAGITYAMVFMPKAKPESGTDGERTGSAGDVSPAPDPGAGGSASSEPRPDQTSPGGDKSPSASASSTSPGANDPEVAQGFTLRDDAEGFQVAVANGWDRAAKNGSGQVVYSHADFELILVPGRDSTSTYGSDPMTYQREREAELQPFRDSTWATSSGMRRIDVGGRVMAEGQFTWTDGEGHELYVRNLAIIIDGRYHVVQLRGPEAERDEVTRLYEQASGTYQVTG
ncbi:protein kinase [Streptomyces sp. NPDC050535]|uniref:protein kinase n=1 Tax=Streptomyces sp. NPDC050535 TaxID=3365626 RepID=UPI0037B86025